MNTRIALLSTAHIHTQHFIDNFKKSTDGRRIVAVWDDVVDRGKRYAASASAPFAPDLQKVLQDPGIDGFIICAENTRHLPLLEQVLPIGKPVFCEKPLVTNIEDLGRVRTLLKKSPTTLFCGYFMPFEADMTGAKLLMDKGELGRITRIRFRNAHNAAYGRWFDNPDLAWFTKPELAGGGAFMDMGTHAIHLVRSLFGPVKEVLADIGNHSGAYPQVDDYGVALLRFSSGILGTVEAGWTQIGGIGGLEAVGTGKTLWHDGTDYVFGTSGKEQEKLSPGIPEPTRVDRLIAVLRNEIPADRLQADQESILDSVAIMDACYKSASSGVWTKVD